ncbi:hypothetical protein ACSMAE_003095 [Cronobacter sakazakii]
MIDFNEIRKLICVLPSDHDASGQHRPTVGEIFAPEQHANALDPNTSIVVGARGTGKSFWAGVLTQKETLAVAAKFYPHLGLDKQTVLSGYDGFTPSRTIDDLVPKGEEHNQGFRFWMATIIKSIEEHLIPKNRSKISVILRGLVTTEDFFEKLEDLDNELQSRKDKVIIVFDALDKLSKEWGRSTKLLDSLFEVVWDLRIRRNITAKIFIRPEQLNDEALSFVEIPKLRSSRVELEWNQTELYGLLFSRLSKNDSNEAFEKFCLEIGVAPKYDNIRRWPLAYNKLIQKDAMSLLAGPYMGKNYKKGGTYDWPYKHLADANGKVTPRSFIKLFVEAAKYTSENAGKAISAEGIRHGLREASKVRVEQLVIEYVWIKRALAPLAGLKVPCNVEEVFERWNASDTVDVIMLASKEIGFLPPFPPMNAGRSGNEALAEAMERIGLIEYRNDGRMDIPDLFRVAAMMLKKGGTPPLSKK